jgi:tetratricopeptide (TPR) repeat protein
MPENPRIEELRRRVESDPASIAFAALAEEYRRLGRYDEAVQTCLAGLKRHPAYLSARVTLGRALVETGDLGAAREQFETVLRTAPENLAAIRGLAQIQERLGESAGMDPHLAQLMRDHLESVAQAPAPAPVRIEPQRMRAEPKPVQAAPEPLEHLDLRHLDLAEPHPSSTFDLPLDSLAAVPDNAPEAPDPAAVAAIGRLERFLAAIQQARHA